VNQGLSPALYVVLMIQIEKNAYYKRQFIRQSFIRKKKHDNELHTREAWTELKAGLLAARYSKHLKEQMKETIYITYVVLSL
jgi:hypothetical protein